VMWQGRMFFCDSGDLTIDGSFHLIAAASIAKRYPFL
jgi:hypothetical protein